jgi:excisionase family DNA binding protein
MSMDNGEERQGLGEKRPSSDENRPARGEKHSEGAEDIERPSTNGHAPREILNIDEAADLLGVSVKTFNKVLHTQDIPARKVGREWKFSRSALVEWVGSGRSRNFYRESEDRAGTGDDSAADLQQRDVDRPVERASADKPRARRTVGWQIEPD